jgi:hypothetical protein
MAVATMLPGLTHAEEAKRQRPRGVQLFYRMVGSQSNAPILPKTESVWTQDRDFRTGNTGMADEGFTEYPFCHGVMDFTFAEHGAIYPRLISGAQADESIVNNADMVIDHVYEPDGCVWGLQAQEFVQTYTATQTELVSIVLMVASEPGKFRAALIEGGPGGRQIGPAKAFYSGSSMEYGIARWSAGQAPTVPGRTYGIRMWREDGKSWTPFLHSRGNAYDGGLVYTDGKPHPESDLALWITEQPDDFVRALPDNADEDGWAYNAEAGSFIARTPNIQLITVSASPFKIYCGAMACYVYDDDGKLVAGPKAAVVCGPVGGAHTTHFMWDKDEFPTEIGARYHVKAHMYKHVEHGDLEKELEAEGEVTFAKRDYRIWAYGSTEPGATSAIYNLKTDLSVEGTLKISFSQTIPAPTTIILKGDGLEGAGPKTMKIELEPGVTEVATTKPWQGHTYTMSMTTTGPTGRIWRTPLYRIRLPRAEDNIQPIEQPVYPKCFVTIAPPVIASGAPAGPIRYEKLVELTNGGFEDGLKGWMAKPDGIIDAPNVGWTAESEAKELGADTKWGDRMAGITHAAVEDRQQVFQKSFLTQTIATTPGHTYLLTGMIYTDAQGGPRGDTRVRLTADPAGGNELEGNNCSQWYWTDADWLRVTHQFVAEADQATVGFSFFRWRDIDAAMAYVDEVHVYDLGAAPAAVDDPAAFQKGAKPKFALTEPATDADDKVEAFVQAPPGHVITGIGARAHRDNITTMWIQVRPLMPDGSLGEPEEIRDGWEPDNHLEAQVILPDGYVATGFGAGIAPEWDVKRFGVFARPLNKDGTLGEEKLFQGGIDTKSGFEKNVKLDGNRVLTGAGLNCNFNDVNGIKGTSAKLTKTAEAQFKK